MDDPDEDYLCEECESIDPVGVLVHGESLPRDIFILASDGDCKFCNLCTSALNSARAVAGKPPLADRFKVSVELQSFWDYLTYDRPHCYINWLQISVVEDTATVSSDKIYIQTIRDANGAVSDDRCFLYGRRAYEQVDLRLIKFWMSQCADQHEDTCKSMPMDENLPEFLIDTSTLMLVPKVGPCQYAALSYCWGNPNVPQLRLEDLKEFASDPNSRQWSIGGRWTEVPQTVKDAILLCQLLSIQYLWVDALCIQHDRPSESALCDTHLAGQMQRIYESAYLTIVAAAGNDSWAGLPGIRNGTRSVTQQTTQFHGAVLASVLGSPYDVMNSSTWSTRGWTLQESILSNRLLIFTERQCFWSCNWSDATYCEEVHREVQPFAPSMGCGQIWYFEFRTAKQFLLACPYLNIHDHYETYNQIIEDYTGRSLTYPQDALEAFSGVASFLSQIFCTTFFWGVPLRFFEQALLFCRNPRSRAPLIRRPQFPSWSWAGWLFGTDGDWLTHDSWVGSRGSKVSLEDFRSINTWYRFVRVIDGNLMEFRSLEEIENVLEGEVGPTRRTVVVQSPGSVLASHILLFDAMAVRLNARFHDPKEDTNDGSHVVSFYFSGKDQSIGTVRLGTVWNTSHNFYLVAIAKETREIDRSWPKPPQPRELEEVVHTLLVETDTEGLSERRYNFTLEEVEWNAAGPKQQTFILV